jgi:hypothetical protein
MDRKNKCSVHPVHLFDVSSKGLQRYVFYYWHSIDYPVIHWNDLFMDVFPQHSQDCSPNRCNIVKWAVFFVRHLDFNLEKILIGIKFHAQVNFWIIFAPGERVK